MSPQAIVIFSVFLILAILSTIIMIKGKVDAYRIVISVLAWLASALLMAFDTNCLSAGQCDVWSWIRTSLYIILPVILIILMAIALLSEDKEKRQEQAKQELTPEQQKALASLITSAAVAQGSNTQSPKQ